MTLYGIYSKSEAERKGVSFLYSTPSGSQVEVTDVRVYSECQGDETCVGQVVELVGRKGGLTKEEWGRRGCPA
jgi:hypothetical protein